MEVIKPVINEDLNNNNQFIFNFEELGQLQDGQEVIFKIEGMVDVEEWVGLETTITGDLAFLQIQSHFRYINNINEYTEWIDLSYENFNEHINPHENEGLEFRYKAIKDSDDYNRVLGIEKTDNIGWYKAFHKGKVAQFQKDFPKTGEYKFFLGDREVDGNTIRFGKDFNTSDTQIEKGDYIWLNTYPLSIELPIDFIIEYTRPELEEGYEPNINIEKLVIEYKKLIVRSDSIISLDYPNQTVKLEPAFDLKAFKFTGYTLDITGEDENRKLDIQFRTSNNRRKWGNWEYLTQDNIKTLEIDTLSLFYIEVAFTRLGTDTTGSINIYDLMLEGDFQNLTEDYTKMNKFGFRKDCNYCEGCGADTSDLCYDEQNPIPSEWLDENCEGTVNFYNISKTVPFYNKMANDSSNLFGWEVDYYRVDPDSSGRDVVLHEYQLFNTVDMKKLKVLVPENKFPDNTVQFNQFDLSLFESFEIHITKDEFHKKFGIAQRPAEYDYLYFCETNRMYRVEHAQPYKDFMNASVYYKVILTKHNNEQNIDNRDQTESFNELVENNSLDNLFGEEVKEDTKVATKEEFHTDLSEEKVRLNVYAPIRDYELESGINLISRNYYDLKSKSGQTAISYDKMDRSIGKGDIRTLTAWININQYKAGMKYYLINNVDSEGKGYEIYFIDGRIDVNWFGDVYQLDINISPQKWYGVVITMQQRERKLEYTIFTTKDSIDPTNLTSSSLEEVNNDVLELEPNGFEGNMEMKIIGSEMKITNIRIFKEYIPKDLRNKVLNQYIVKDTSKLLFADNATKTVVAPSHKF